MRSWTDIERDALTEMFNLGMGVAAASLSKMVGSEVDLFVPSLDFVSISEVSARLHKNEGRLVTIRESFNGAFTGEAFLIFPEEGSLHIVGTLLESPECNDGLTESAREAMCEVGNIVLNACLSSLCNMLRQEIRTELPELAYWESAEEKRDTVGIFMRMDFRIRNTGHHGYLLIFMHADSVNALKAQIDSVLAELG